MFQFFNQSLDEVGQTHTIFMTGISTINPYLDGLMAATQSLQGCDYAICEACSACNSDRWTFEKLRLALKNCEVEMLKREALKA